MDSYQDPNPVQTYLSDMMALERQLEGVVDHLGPFAAVQPKAAAALDRYQGMVRAHRAALDERAQVIGGQIPDRPAAILAIPTPLAAILPEHAVSQVLHTLYAGFNHVAFGYSLLHIAAHRAFDSIEPGSTAELAETHLRDYAGAIQELNQMVSDAMVWELTGLGHDCECKCPACSLGLCLCSPHGTLTINQVWEETRPAAPDGGLWVRPPWSTSMADQAGLGAGDRILTVDEQAIASDWDVPTLQKGIRAHQAGEAIRLGVQRATGEIEEVILRRA
jgi:hypothetical protein